MLLLSKVGSSCLPLKANKDTRLVEKRVCFILKDGNWGLEYGWRGWFRVRRPTPHNWQSVGKSLYRWREGATCRNITVNSDNLLELSHAVVWSVSFWLFYIQLIFNSSLSISEDDSQNYGSLCLRSVHQMVNFFHLVWVSVSTRQLTGYGSEYYL